MTGGDIAMFAIKQYALNNKISFGTRELDPIQRYYYSRNPETKKRLLEETEGVRRKDLVNDGNLTSIFIQVLFDLGLIKGKGLTKNEIKEINQEAEEIREKLDLVA